MQRDGEDDPLSSQQRGMSGTGLPHQQRYDTISSRNQPQQQQRQQQQFSIGEGQESAYSNGVAYGTDKEDLYQPYDPSQAQTGNGESRGRGESGNLLDLDSFMPPSYSPAAFLEGSNGDGVRGATNSWISDPRQSDPGLSQSGLMGRSPSQQQQKRQTSVGYFHRQQANTSLTGGVPHLPSRQL